MNNFFDSDNSLRASNLSDTTTDELERLIEQLVDGELPNPLRRPLLLELDRRPQGWRRCALAFLETQAWTSSAGSPVMFINDEPHEDVQRRSPQHGHGYSNGHSSALSNGHVRRFRVTPAHVAHRFEPTLRIKHIKISPGPTDRTNGNGAPVSPREDRIPANDRKGERNQRSESPSGEQPSAIARLQSHLRSPGGLAAVMAACFLIAFTLGLAVRGGYPFGDDNSAQSQSMDFASQSAADANGGQALAGNDGTTHESDLNDNSAVSLAGNQRPDGNLADRNVAGDGTWGTVTLASDASDAGAAPMELPVVEGPSMAQWLSTLPPPVSPEVAAELRKMGREVFMETHLQLMQLQDGRFVVVPVDDVQVRYVGGNMIQ